MKNNFEQLYDYLRQYVDSSENALAAIEDINHAAFVLYAETQLERQSNEPT
jgi:hypothetical protein